MISVCQEVTREIIDEVFADRKVKKMIRHPERAKKICERRLAGMLYKDIGEELGVSETTCIRCCRDVVRLYRVFVEVV